MRTIALLAILLSAVCLSCTHKRQQFKAGTTPDGDLTITGVNDTVADIQVTSADKDTIIYDTPECCLWYVEDLPDKYKGKTVSMWVEHTVYRENTQAINVFVANPTNVPLSFGRKWDMHVWNGSKWVSPKAKFSPFIWINGFPRKQNSLLSSGRTMRLPCPKGCCCIVSVSQSAGIIIYPKENTA